MLFSEPLRRREFSEGDRWDLSLRQWMRVPVSLSCFPFSTFVALAVEGSERHVVVEVPLCPEALERVVTAEWGRLSSRA